jgi:hypothetical protein
MKILAAGTTFVFAAVIVSVALAFAMGGLGLWVAVLSLSAGATGAVLAWRTTDRTPATPLGFWDWTLVGVFTLVSLRAFLWLIFTRGDEICVLSPNNLGDLSLHLNFIRYLASGVRFWPESTILTGAPLTYPLGADLLNALGEVLDMETNRGLIWTGLAGAALTGAALWRWGGAFGLAAFLFNGGLAGFVVLTNGKFADFQSTLIWKNFFLSMFVTQRGLLFALPAGLILLTAWREEFFRQGQRVVPRWLQVVLYAGMPLFSLHTFIFLSAVLAGIFVVRNPHRRSVAILVGASFLPATLGVLLVTGFLFATGGLHLAFGWILNNKGWLAFCRDFGVTLPLALAAGVMAFRNKDAEARCFAGIGIGIFAVCVVVAFAPWEWDNMKLMMWCWLALAPYLWSGVLKPMHMAPRTVLCFLLFFSGAVSLIGGLDARHGYPLARRSEVDVWRAVTAGIPPEARFAAAPEYNHPLLLLGRKVACGYDGHLWSHGLDYQAKMDLLKKSLAGSVPWAQSAPILGVEWVAIRHKEQPGVLNDQIGALLDLRPFLKSDPDRPAHQTPPR